jgi:Autochaperone Domain Type 1
MRAVGAARWFLSSTSIMALAAIFAPERAYATCTYDVPGTGIIALSGDMCSAAGPYSGAPPGYVAFSASGGGVITSTGGVTINNTPTPVANAFGVYANGGQINLTAGIADVQTSGATAYDFYARDGGAITFADGKIESTGAGASGLYASGAGSTITVTGAPTIETGLLGAAADGVVADMGGAVSLMNGGHITTYAGGSVGLFVDGSSSTITGAGLTVQSFGDSVSPPDTGAAFNNGAGSSAAPGLILTNSTLAATGMAAFGVYTSNGGSTALSGDSISTGGDSAPGLWASGPGSTITATNGTSISTGGSNAPGVQADTGGQVTLNGGTVMTSGAGATGLYVIGANSTVIATDVAISTGASPGPGTNAVGVLASAGGTATLSGGSVMTSGNSAYGVVANGGGYAQLTGTMIGTIGDGSGGLGINGAGSEIDAANAIITTTGGYDSSTGQHSYGVYNGPYGSYAAGGVAKLTDTSVSTQGAQMYGVITSTGGSTTILGGSISTAGTQAFGVVAVNGGTTTIANSLVGPTTITTTGTSANAIDAAQGGSVQVSGAQITTSLDGSQGLVVTGSSSTLMASGVSVTTKGGIDTTTGYYANGAYNGPGGSDLTGGTLSLTDSTIAVSGAQVFGVFTGTGGATTISGGSVTTSGVGSIGLGTYGGGSTALTNSSVTTSGQDAHALVVTGTGSQANLSGSNTFVTQGAGAIGLYATAGGGVTASGPVTITTIGGVSPSTGLGAFGVNADGAGSNIALAAATITTSGAGATGLFASDASSSGAAGSITVSGPLNLQTKNAAAAAVALQGAGASILATGGGTIASAGDAIDFLGGTNQVATFDNFTIANTTGNLIFADPSVSTINFNNTTANAGLNNLLDATNGSAITLNANASTLTGAIQTDSTSTTAVNLNSGSVWTMTGSSAVSNLAVTNSAIVFAPPGSGVSFKTLTVGNYVGAGANLTMNTVLGGTGSASDQLVINGGSATGSTLLTIHNVGGAGAQTTGNGIPVVVVSNGGTTASNAFALASTPVAGGYKYSLEDTNNDWYLVSSPTSTQADIANSVTNVAKAQQQQIVTNRVLDSILIGATEQVNCSNCSSGFGSIGSYALGAHGRHSLSDELTVIGGFSYGEYSADGVTVSNAPSIAGSLIYDFVNWGRSRPFVEVGGGVTPFEDVQYARTYGTGIGSGTGYGKAIDRNLGIFGRVGWVDRLTPIDEAAVYGDISRSWMIAGGYTEAAGPSNPYPATVQTGLDTLNVARVGGQYTHLFNGNIEVNVSTAVAYGFDAGSGNQFSVVDFGAIAPYPIANSYWLEYGGRVGYRLPNKMVLDAFLLGTAFGEIGKTLHGGVALRLFF